MSDYSESMHEFLKTPEGKALIEQLNDIIVEATLARILAEEEAEENLTPASPQE